MYENIHPQLNKQQIIDAICFTPYHQAMLAENVSLYLLLYN